MKILVITNLYPPHEIGGYEIRCRDFCEITIAAGHEIRVLTSDHRVPGRLEIEQPHVSRKLQVHGMYGHSWLSIGRVWKLERHNHETLAAEIKAFQPDLIHVWCMGGISKSLLLRLERGNIPLVYDVSDHWIARSTRADVWLSWWNATGSGWKKFIRKALNFSGVRNLLDRGTPNGSWDRLRFKNIYFSSAFMRDFTASKGWPVSHGRVIHCGIETRAFSVKSDHGRFEKLLWVGRLAADKDPLTAIRALAEAHRKGSSHLTLDLFGHGEAAYVSQIEQEISRLGLEGKVSRRTAAPAEMRQLYQHYDALLFTSNWGEPFALTPLEAMASGLPVITSLDGGQSELARDRVNSLVAAAGDPALYASRLSELADSPELRKSIAATALAEVREHYDMREISRQIEAFFLESLKS